MLRLEKEMAIHSRILASEISWHTDGLQKGSDNLATKEHLFYMRSVAMPWKPYEQYEKENDRTLKEELPRSGGAQYATGDQWRDNSRKNEEMESKQKHHPVVDVTGDESKVRCCKEQYCIGAWNVRSLNQGKSEVVKQEMVRMNVYILGISELKRLEWVNLTQMTIISTTVGRNPLEKME